MSNPLPTAMTGHGHADFSHGWQSMGLVPRNLGIAVLRVYRATISHVYGDVCKYYPSCSAYAVGAIQQHGLARGTVKTAARLARCHPWAEGGIDEVPPREGFRFDLTRGGFVVPKTGRKD